MGFDRQNILEQIEKNIPTECPDCFERLYFKGAGKYTCPRCHKIYYDYFGLIKKYLEENELKVLNNLVSGYFDLAEINAIEHKPMYMDDYVKQLDSVLSSGNRKLLTGAGSVSHKQALEKAKSEYRKYQEITLTPVEKAYLESIKEVSKEVKRR